MWQRRQTIFLLVALFAILMTVFNPLLGVIPKTGIGDLKILFCIGFYGSATLTWHVSLLVVMILDFIVSLLAIFMFKNRKRQMKAIRWAMFGVIVFYVLLAIAAFTADGTAHFYSGTFIAIAIIVAQYAALRGVKHDEELVKSMDRIR